MLVILNASPGVSHANATTGRMHVIITGEPLEEVDCLKVPGVVASGR